MPLDGLRLCAAAESDCPVGLPTYPPPAKEVIESVVRSLGAYPSACATTVLSLLREKGYEITLAAANEQTSHNRELSTSEHQPSEGRSARTRAKPVCLTCNQAWPCAAARRTANGKTGTSP